MTVQGYRVELRPTEAQRVRLGMHAGLCRVVENFCLERVKGALAQREAERTYGIPEQDLTPVPWAAPAMERAWRAVHPTRYAWFTAQGLSSRVPKQACRLRAAGLKNFFASRGGTRRGRRMGFPTWRQRKHGSRFGYDADRARPTGARTVTLPAVGAVHTLQDMSWLTGRLADGRARVLGTTVREQAGRWWVSFQIEVDRAEVNNRRRPPVDAPACGVDLGLTTFAVITDDTGAVEEIRSPRALRAAQRKLRRANKHLARTQPTSKNRDKARVRVARTHLDVAHQRAQFLHTLTTRLARTKRAIAVEDLNVAAMMRNRRLARSIADAGFGEFIRQLQYKTQWYGSTLWTAGRWYPSSKTCCACGTINTGLSLADRRWACACGAQHDRDHNAASNLLALMLAALT